MLRSALLLFFLPLATIAAENVGHNDLVGTWHSYWSSVDGEVNVLTINDDLSSQFARASIGAPNSLEYSWKSPEVTFVDDLVIIEYRGDDKLIYKLVLAGWKSETTRRLFGQMYMYRDGHIFDGLPIALESRTKGED
jgi:hypothetical protein